MIMGLADIGQGPRRVGSGLEVEQRGRDWWQKLDFIHPCHRRLLKGKRPLWIWVIWVGKGRAGQWRCFITAECYVYKSKLIFKYKCARKLMSTYFVFRVGLVARYSTIFWIFNNCRFRLNLVIWSYCASLIYEKYSLQALPFLVESFWSGH